MCPASHRAHRPSCQLIYFGSQRPWEKKAGCLNPVPSSRKIHDRSFRPRTRCFFPVGTWTRGRCRCVARKHYRRREMYRRRFLEAIFFHNYRCFDLRPSKMVSIQPCRKKNERRFLARGERIASPLRVATVIRFAI